MEAYGYSVITAADGTEALAMYVGQKEKIALVVIDMMMPYMDSASMIRALKKVNPEVKIIAVSGMKINGEQTEFAPNVTFLHKPYTSETLLRAISRLLRGG